MLSCRHYIIIWPNQIDLIFSLILCNLFSNCCSGDLFHRPMTKLFANVFIAVFIAAFPIRSTAVARHCFLMFIKAKQSARVNFQTNSYRQSSFLDPFQRLNYSKCKCLWLLYLCMLLSVQCTYASCHKPTSTRSYHLCVFFNLMWLYKNRT